MPDAAETSINSEKMVFVLGAGFTRAFFPKAPLLVDEWGIPVLQEEFKSFTYATAILADARAQSNEGRVDLERLMTRLTGMPYDASDARREFSLLESRLKNALVQRLKKARDVDAKWNTLKAFASFVLKNQASIVTFNYDDFLDQSLWDAKRITTMPEEKDRPCWHPDGGYGFFCRPSSVCVSDTPAAMETETTLLLKLHGSINWYSRRGEVSPHGPSGLLHHEKWLEHSPPIPPEVFCRIPEHLEPEPFIVPPVLAKSELTLHPVLHVVWERAVQTLKAATRVVFIGYSLPDTDLASRVLFTETLTRKASTRSEFCRVEVVNLAADEREKKEIKTRYRKLIPGLPNASFAFDGAVPWIERLTQQSLDVDDALPTAP